MSTSFVTVMHGFILLSDEDRHLLSHKWRIIRPDGKKAYVSTEINGATAYIHRLILDAQKGQEVDHINGDGLDNRRENLRLATRSQNCANRKGYAPKSGFRGVYQHSNGEGWQVKLSVDGKHIGGGSFSCPEAAARRYDDLAALHFGDFAILNFPQTENV